MTDKWDAKAILIGVWHRGVPVASARVIDCSPSEEWEHDRFVQWQAEWPDRANCVEISRFCTARKYRNWSVIQALSVGLGHASLLTGKRFALACCTDELLEFYRVFFGVHATGIAIQHDDLGPKQHFVFVNDIWERMAGRGIAFFPWCALWPTVTEAGYQHSNSRAFLQAEGRTLLAKLVTGKLLQPAINWMLARKRSVRRPDSSRVGIDGR